MQHLKRSSVIALVGLAIVLIAVSVYSRDNPRSSSTASSSSMSRTSAQQQYSINDPASIWIVVNKKRPLKPAEYAPSDLVVPQLPLRLDASDPEMLLRKPAADALKQMLTAAQAQGAPLRLSSGYRSYTKQVELFNYYVSQQGLEVAESQSAHPGYSEHQTGLAADLSPTDGTCDVQDCFADTPQGKWLANNAYKYGFIIRYPKDKQQITGYIYEPWHVRYVGKYLATKMHARNVPTLEQQFELPPAPGY